MNKYELLKLKLKFCNWISFLSSWRVAVERMMRIIIISSSSIHVIFIIINNNKKNSNSANNNNKKKNNESRRVEPPELKNWISVLRLIRITLLKSPYPNFSGI